MWHPVLLADPDEGFFSHNYGIYVKYIDNTKKYKEKNQ